jgi:hypothetical protein
MGIAIALCALRSGQRWSWWTLFLTLIFLLTVRLMNDPACFGALSQHGCHTFLGAEALGFIGLAIARRVAVGRALIQS